MPEIPQPEDDGLCIPTVGEWSRDKHYFLMRYIDAFTTSMKNKWSELHYIDLFAGAGVERLETSNTLAWGSPMIAALARFKFTKLHLCENDPKKHEALKARIARVNCLAQVLCGDANEKIHEIVKSISTPKTLSLAFLDPYGLHIDMETLQTLKHNRVDLIIFFADRLDALRNWRHYYLENPDSNLDRFLGSDSNWRKEINDTPQHRQVETFRQLYVDQLKKRLGYTHFDYERISNKGRPLYSLIFCSRSQFAAGLWRRIAGKKPDGQRTFDFDG